MVENVGGVFQQCINKVVLLQTSSGFDPRLCVWSSMVTVVVTVNVFGGVKICSIKFPMPEGGGVVGRGVVSQ